MKTRRLIAGAVLLAAVCAVWPAAAKDTRPLRKLERKQAKKDASIVALAREAASKDPTNAEVRNRTGEILYNNGFRQEAIEHWRAAAVLRTDYARPHINLGLAYYDRGNTELALAEFRDAILHNSNDAEAQYYLGLALMDIGQPEEAIKAWKKAVSINPEYVDARQSLGDSYLNEGRTDQAIAEYQKAIRVQPNNEDLYYNYAFALKDRRRYDDAIKAFQKFIDLSGKELEGIEEVQNCKREIEEIKKIMQDEI